MSIALSKKADDPAAQQIADSSHNGRGFKQSENADAEQFGQTLLVAASKIIADYRGNAVDIPPEQTAEQTLRVPDDGKGCYAVRAAEAHEDPVEQNGDDRERQHTDHLGGAVDAAVHDGFPAPFGAHHMKYLFAAGAEGNRSHDRRCGVTDTGCNGSSCQPPAEYTHEQPVQHNVQNTAEHIEKCAQPRFADCNKAELKHHAEHRKRNGDQHRDHVFPAVVQQSIIRAEKAAERIQKEKAHDRQHHTEHKRDRHHQRKILTGFLVFSLTDFPGYQCVPAAAEHHAKCRSKIGHGHGDVDGRQSIGVHKAGDKDTVHRGV